MFEFFRKCVVNSYSFIECCDVEYDEDIGNKEEDGFFDFEVVKDLEVVFSVVFNGLDVLVEGKFVNNLEVECWS